jgi:hypothetical protein
MNICELLLGGVIGAIFGIGATIISQYWFDKYFECRYLQPLIGKYDCFHKNGKKVANISDFEVTKTNGRTMEIITTNHKSVKSKSEIYFDNPKYGKGWYSEINESEDNRQTFGIREVIVISNVQLNIWNKYSKDKSYEDDADFSTINQSIICKKKQAKN